MKSVPCKKLIDFERVMNIFNLSVTTYSIFWLSLELEWTLYKEPICFGNWRSNRGSRRELVVAKIWLRFCQITHCSLCYALKQSYWVPHKKANLKEICRLENDLYKIAIGRILATHAQNYQIHSTHRVTRGNLYAKILNEQDSKELSPRSLDKMLLELQVNSQNVQSTQLSKFFKFSKSSKFSKIFCMIFKHV